MNFKNKLCSLLALCAVIAFTGCGDKKDDPNKLTPDAQKQKLETIGIDLLNEINPADFQTVTVTLGSFLALFETTEVPETPSFQLAKQLQRIIEKQDLAGLSSMANPSSDAFAITQLFGVYTFNYKTFQWEKTESNSELKFVFQSEEKEATFRGVCSAETHTIPVEGGNITIPKSVTFTLTQGATTLLQFEAGIPTLEMDKMKAATKVSLTVGGITMANTISFDPSLCAATASMSKGNKSLISFSANVNGSNFLDSARMITSIDSRIGVMNQCHIFANCPNPTQFIQKAAEIEYKYPMNDKGLRGATYYNENAALMNNSFDLFMNYDGSATKAIKMEISGRYTFGNVGFNEQTSYFESFEPIPYFVFADGSKHSSEEFFSESSFTNLINQAAQLVQGFSRLFGQQ